MAKRNKNLLVRGTLPTNDKPICVRVLKNETPVNNKVQNPHSPFNFVSPSVIPVESRFNKRKSTRTPRSYRPN